MASDRTFDVIIVGAGTAGCALAGRLSEVESKRVLLLEAGPDYPADEEHADIRDPFPTSYGNPKFSWPNLNAEISPDPSDGGVRATRHYLQGYGVGGSSNIQGMAALRGLPDDYDGWSELGVEGWRWNDVLPYFKKLERDLDFTGPAHGASGPVPIRRVPSAEWAPFAKAVGAALERRGYPLIEDCNGDFREGVTSIPMSNLPDQRVSASMAYLTRAVRRRSNLTIAPDTLAEKIVLTDGHVAGVFARTRSGARLFSAPEVIISCGAIASPAIMMRSGIGATENLRRAGIEVVHHLPGVGRNLQNHPEISIVTHFPGAAAQSSRYRSWQQNCLRYSSLHEACPSTDMLLVTRNKSAWHPLGRRLGGLGIAVYKPFSKGQVDVVSADPAIAPRVQFNLLADPRDFERLTNGFRLVLDILSDNEVAAVRNEAFLADGKAVRRLNTRTAWNWLQTLLITYAFDRGFIRRAVLRETMVDIARLRRDDGALLDLVRQRAQPTHHVCGTCRMGRNDDPDAVVDSHAHVRGIPGLRVVDASIFPTLMRANTHIPVIMAAEKLADQVKAAWAPNRTPLRSLKDA